jgi:hypothetical protein
MTANRTITVYGASGHTGQFVVSELHRRRWTPVLSGRDPAKLRAAVAVGPGELELRPAAVDSSTALDHALDGAAAVTNCAGPVLLFSGAADRGGATGRHPLPGRGGRGRGRRRHPRHYHDRARDAGIVIISAMAFYGGLGDLLATAATRGWTSADEISTANGLSSWQPTLGTQNSGQVSRRRRQGRRIVYTNGHMELRTDDARRRTARRHRHPAPRPRPRLPRRTQPGSPPPTASTTSSSNPDAASNSARNHPSASGCAGSSKLPTPGGPTTANSAATPTGEPTTATPPSASPPPSSSSSAASSTTAPDGAQPEHLSAQVLRRSRRPVACRP